MIEIREMEGAGVEAELQLPSLEHRAVLIVKNRQQQLALQFRRDRIPVDVEVVGEHRARPVLEHIAPPSVGVDVEPHVVRDEVEDVPHVPRGERVREGVVIGFGPELGIELVVVADVVAVQAARTRLEDRRCIAIGDPSAAR